MTSINDSTLMPGVLRDTRRMYQFVSLAAAVAGLLFGLDIGVIAGALPFITDPCLSWEDTELLLEKLAAAVDSRF